jgi:FtsP/CotA-like multicopper oxidase with cupredoxin domain
MVTVGNWSKLQLSPVLLATLNARMSLRHRAAAGARTGRPYNPVVTLNGWTLPWRMNNGVKEFHLVAEPVVREVMPGFKVNMWGYNGQSPGPHHRSGRRRPRAHLRDQQAARAHHHPLARPAPAQRHGRRGRPDQPQIPVGKTFVYEFEARRPGTFMYHPHADEMVQMAMGMMGMWVTHPKPSTPTSSARWTATSASCSTPLTWSPAARRPRSTPCWTSTSGAGTAGCSRPSTRWCAQGDRVRIRVGNLTMTNHPIHLHGTSFCHRHRRRPDPAQHALARGDHRRGRGPDAPDRVDRRRRRATGPCTATRATTP